VDPGVSDGVDDAEPAAFQPSCQLAACYLGIDIAVLWICVTPLGP
jgi:hypothetical protein